MNDRDSESRIIGAPRSLEAHVPSDQNDPDLEGEFEKMAQLLLDVYLWRLQQERQTPGQ